MSKEYFLDLETSFNELKKFPVASFIVLPINANLDSYKDKIEKLKFPLWLKLNTSQHKTKINAVKKINDFKELKKEYKKLKKKFRNQKFIIQEHINGLKIIVGIKSDKTFGKILLIGSGGTQVEIIKDIEFRVLPLAKQEIFQALEELKIFPLLKNLQLNKLIKLIKKFSDLVLKSEIKEADLNPIIINKKQVKIVDARISI